MYEAKQLSEYITESRNPILPLNLLFLPLIGLGLGLGFWNLVGGTRLLMGE